MNSRRYLKVLLRLPRSIFLLLLIALMGLLLFAITHPQRVNSEIGNYDQERALWYQEITAQGGVVAYTHMIERYSALPIAEAHDYAHAFGTALFAVEGADGFGACGHAYEWGCYHSFIERLISSEGLSAIATMGASCSTLPKADVQECVHGLGHGVLSYLGVTEFDEALDLCAQHTNPTYGCASGVFMELLNGNLHEDRPPLPYRDAERYWPCTDVVSEFKEVCYRRLPYWWWQSNNAKPADRINLMIENCTEIPR